MRMVRGWVPSRRAARRSALCDGPRVSAIHRARASGSSSSRMYARPTYHRPPLLTRTLGSASRLRTYWARRPCSATIQNRSPCSPLMTAVWRRLPLVRPVVSSNANMGSGRPARSAALTGGFCRYFSTATTSRRLRSPDIVAPGGLGAVGGDGVVGGGEGRGHGYLAQQAGGGALVGGNEDALSAVDLGPVPPGAARVVHGSGHRLQPGLPAPDKPGAP